MVVLLQDVPAGAKPSGERSRCSPNPVPLLSRNAGRLASGDASCAGTGLSSRSVTSGIRLQRGYGFPEPRSSIIHALDVRKLKGIAPATARQVRNNGILIAEFGVKRLLMKAKQANSAAPCSGDFTPKEIAPATFT